MARLLLALFALLSLTGCTVPVVGSTGVGLDAQGRPVGILAVCSEHIDGATLYFDDPGATTDQGQSQDAGRWAADTPVTSLATWPLADAATGWTVEMPLLSLDPDRVYHLYGWTRDNSSSTSGVTFTLAQLAQLKPGQVRYFAGYDEKHDTDLYKTGTTSDLRDYACSE